MVKATETIKKKTDIKSRPSTAKSSNLKSGTGRGNKTPLVKKQS